MSELVGSECRGALLDPRNTLSLVDPFASSERDGPPPLALSRLVEKPRDDFSLPFLPMPASPFLSTEMAEGGDVAGWNLNLAPPVATNSRFSCWSKASISDSKSSMSVSSPYLTGAIVRITADVMAEVVGVAHGAVWCHQADHEKETKGHFVRTATEMVCVHFKTDIHRCYGIQLNAPSFKPADCVRLTNPSYLLIFKCTSVLSRT